MRLTGLAGRRGAARRRPARGRLLLALAATVLLAVAVLANAAVAAATPPKVTTQPVSKTVEEGQSASFTSAASGSPTPTVQWQLSTNGGASWTPIEGATANQLTIASAQTSESGDQFRAVFTNSAGEATSKAATLTVRKVPAVTKQPASITVEEGQSAVFEATASGFPAPTVQWQVSTNGGTTWGPVAGATSTQLTIASAKTSESGRQYRAVFKNVAGTATSEAATLTVQKAPAVTKQPLNTTVEEGQSAVFEATASGFPAPGIQWELSTDGGGTWAPLEGATASKLTVANAQISQNGQQYRAVFANAAGTATSQAATLTVQKAPAVTGQPENVTVEVGESALFEATASGFPAPTVQWEVSTNGGGAWAAIPGATSNQLTVANAQASESGREYRAVFTNAAGKAISQAATLTVATSHYSAVSWGENRYRQLGAGSSSLFISSPVPVSGLTFVSSIAAGGRHSLALLADGTAVAWGNNDFGQLGDGNLFTSNVPVAVEGLAGVKALAAGGNHSLALLTNGTVMAWGDNESGQLGTGNTQDSELPVAVKGLTGVKSISAGGDHSLALLANGTVMAWGSNEHGQLGTGNTKSSTVPVAVKGLSGVAAVSAGGDFSLALLGGGTARAWGSNRYGQLGTSTGEEGFSDLPVGVGTLTGVSALAAGAEHGLALLSNGSVMAWGEDSYGELGNGTIKEAEQTPVPVSGLSGVAAISAGGQDSVALLSQGTLMTWGIDTYGTLGNGTSGGPSAVPVSVEGLGQVANVSAGGSHMLAFGEPRPKVTSVSPNVGPTGGGTTVTLTGAAFTGATAVKFGAAEATNVTVNSASSITATSPPGAGTVDVTVITPSGTSTTAPADRYTYQSTPTVKKLSVKSGPTGGATSVTITGTAFAGTTAVSFGSAEATQFTVNSPTSITAVSPPGSVGSVDVRVTTTSGTSPASTSDRFKYTPTVESVTPNGGSTAGGTSVTVTGSGFATAPGATAFKFAKAKATSVSCASSTSCTMTAPAGAAGTVDVTATVNKVTSPVNAPGDRFTYS